MSKGEQMKYWVFNHTWQGATKENIQELIERSIKNNYCHMQYEYGIQEDKGRVTQNWKKAQEVQEGDVIFLRGQDNIYAMGFAIAPRQSSTCKLKIQDIINNREHGAGHCYRSDTYSGIIHFDDAPVFYEALNGTKNNWGQRIDVDSWQYYLPTGCYAKDSSNYNKKNYWDVIREVKQTSADKWIQHLKGAFMGEELTLLSANKNLVLTGSPGTGKTYTAKTMAIKLIFGKDKYELLSDDQKKQLDGQVLFVQFHPSYDYTDFVEGLRPVRRDGGTAELGFERKDGVFKQLCKHAIEHPMQPHVCIIDEINRGEISKIFGELFFAIDSGYRGEKGKIRTQYQNLIDSSDAFADGFYVPENVYIIGTMNDIDRSVESMDFAIRRRFSWYEVSAEISQKMMENKDAWKDGQGTLVSMNNSDLEMIKQRMNNLNQKILDPKYGLGTAYQVGASYFLKYSWYPEFPFERLWDHHIKGVLAEYLRGIPHADDFLNELHTAYDTEANH